MMSQHDYEELIETIEFLSESHFSDKLKKAEKELKNNETYNFDEVFN